MDLSEVLREAMQLAREQRADEALVRLIEGLDSAREQKDDHATALLSRNAALICIQMGRLNEAAHFYHGAAQVEPKDAYTQWALGDIYKALGDVNLSQNHWDQFAKLAGESDDPELRELLCRHHLRVSGDAE